MHPVRKQRLILVLFLVAGVTLVVGLVMYALRQNINLYYPPAEIAQGKAPVGQVIRAGGMVVPGSIQRDQQSLKVTFQVTDYESNLTVSYEGILPDLFGENQGAVVKGRLDENRHFTASEVLAKHDENYMPPEVSESLKKAHKNGKVPGQEE